MTAKPPSLPRPPRRRVFRFLLKAFAAILVVLLVWHVSFRIRTHREIQRLEAKARANGEPWTLAELAATYYGPVPDEENAAIPLMALWEEEDPAFWAAFHGNIRPLPNHSGIKLPEGLPAVNATWKGASSELPLSSENLEAAERFLSEHANHMKQLHGAIQHRKARFKVRFEDGQAALLPHLGRLRNEAQLLRVESLVLMARGDLDGAIRSTVACFGLAELLRDEPLLISQLVRIACQMSAIRSVEDLLNQTHLSDQQIHRIENAINSSDDSRIIWRALIGERVLSSGIFQNLPQVMDLINQSDADTGEERVSSSEVSIGLRIWNLTGIPQADRAYMLDTFEAAISCAQQQFPDSLHGYKDVFSRFEDQSFFPPHIVSRLLLPALSKALNRQAGLEAQRRAALMVLAIERYRNQSNKDAPAALSELAPNWLPAIPEDPFDGDGLRYRRKEKGYVVYSVGADYLDNEGIGREEAQAARTKARQSGQSNSAASLQFDEAFTVGR